MGNVFLSQYYTVFDMTSLDEGKDYIEIVLGKINKNIDAVDDFSLSKEDIISA